LKMTDDVRQRYFDRFKMLLADIKSPFITDKEVKNQVETFNKWLEHSLSGQGRKLVDTEMVALSKIIRGFYDKFQDDIQTESQFEKAYKELPNVVKNLYLEDDVLEDWQRHKESMKVYQDMEGLLEQTTISEDALKRLYTSLVETLLYNSNNPQVQILTWSGFLTKHRSKIVSQEQDNQNVIRGEKVKNQKYHFKTGKVNIGMVVCNIGSYSLFVGETEVTLGNYMAVTGHYSYPNIFYRGSRTSIPVTDISFYDCILFCNKLSEKLGYQPCYTMDIIRYYADPERPGSTPEYDINDKETWDYQYITSATVKWNQNADGFRLPTEKEWEICAKAGTNNTWAGCNDERFLNRYAIYYSEEDGGGMYTEEGMYEDPKSKKPNEWGLYGMSGGVWDICWPSDRYGEPLLEVDDDKLGYVGKKGGSFREAADECTVESTTGFTFTRDDDWFDFGGTGFRIVKNMQLKEGSSK
jgi:formylglycine-generating enzyme required for sulfatase activity